MFKQVLILLIGVSGVLCTGGLYGEQGQVNQPLYPQEGYEVPSHVQVPSYVDATHDSSYAQPQSYHNEPMPAYDYNGQYEDLEPLGPVNEEAQQKRRSRIGAHLKDLARSASKSAVRAYEDAKPALSNIKADIDSTMTQIKNHPKVVKTLETGKSHYEIVKAKADPLLQKSGQRVKGLYEKYAPRRPAHPYNTRYKEQYEASNPLPNEPIVPVVPAGAYTGEHNL